MNIAALKRAVKASADWKGSITGHPDPLVEIAFDLEIAKQRKAVQNAARIRREHQMLLMFIARLADLPDKMDHRRTWQALSAARRQARTLMHIAKNPYA